jgi:hypothetical protein
MSLTDRRPIRVITAAYSAGTVVGGVGRVVPPHGGVDVKLLVCGHCGDVRKMHMEDTYCECGKSRGRYLDQLHCEVEGDDAHVMGLRNDEFLRALCVKAECIQRTGSAPWIYLLPHFEEPRGR